MLRQKPISAEAPLRMMDENTCMTEMIPVE